MNVNNWINDHSIISFSLLSIFIIISLWTAFISVCPFSTHSFILFALQSIDAVINDLRSPRCVLPINNSYCCCCNIFDAVAASSRNPSSAHFFCCCWRQTTNSGSSGPPKRPNHPNSVKWSNGIIANIKLSSLKQTHTNAHTRTWW